MANARLREKEDPYRFLAVEAFHFMNIVGFFSHGPTQIVGVRHLQLSRRSMNGRDTKETSCQNYYLAFPLCFHRKVDKTKITVTGLRL